jgi:hypothetical protein
MSTVVYRDKATNDRILIPLNPALDEMYNEESHVVQCIEVWNFPERDGPHMNCRQNFMTITQLERFYKREEL